MINGIAASGNNIVVSDGSAFMPYVNMSNPSAGMMRYNGSNQCIETYDGITWLTINANYVKVDLSPSANSAIAWALTKMAEEAELQRMVHSRPAVRAAYEAFKRAGEQLQTTIILSKDEQTTT